MFVVVSVLFTGLGILATKGTAETSILRSPIWVAAISLYFALKAYSAVPLKRMLGVQTPVSDRSPRFLPKLSSESFQIAFGIALALAVIVFHLIRVNISSHELRESRQIADDAQKSIRDLKAGYDKQFQTLTSEYNRRFAETQAEIRELQTHPPLKR